MPMLPQAKVYLSLHLTIVFPGLRKGAWDDCATGKRSFFSSKGGTMKKIRIGIVALLAAFVMALSLTACSSQSTETATEETPAPAAEEATETAPAEEQATNLTILYEEDDSLINTYSLLAVNPDAPFVDADGNEVADVAINSEGAAAFIDWMLSDEGLELIADYGMEDFGESLFTVNDDAPRYEGEIPQATDDTKAIRLSTTTSVNDSGLLDYLLPYFEDEYGYEVEVYSAGTGKAIANAESGNADAILVHSKSQEEEFVTAGFAYTLPGFDSERLSFMHNYFVLCGPADDPAGVANAATALDAFAQIADGKYPFVSRGDASGTHTKEISLWPEDLGITTEADSVADYTDWYTYSNAGMGACLAMANETNAYILSDKATFLTFEANGGIVE